MNTKRPKLSRFAHIYGMNGQFILLEQHSEWMPVNDADYDNAPALPEGFVFADEAFYTTDGSVPPLVLPDNIKIFNEEARKLERRRLDALALEELGKNLAAVQAETDLEALLEKIEFHLKQDNLFK